MSMYDAISIRPSWTSIAVYAIVIGSLSAGWVSGHYMPAAEPTLDRQIAVDNLVTATLYIVCVALYAVHWRSFAYEHITAQHLRIVGIMIGFSAWAIHRSYWAVWRILRDDGYAPAAKRMVEDFAWLTTIMQFAIWLGACIIMLPFAIHYFGRGAWWLPSVATAGLWASIYLMLSLIRGSVG